MSRPIGDVSAERGVKHVVVVELHRPPANYFDVHLIRALADAYEEAEADKSIRCVVLCSEGRHFCAGADFAGASDAEPPGDDLASTLYTEVVRLFQVKIPVVAAVQGAAIGRGLGLPCSSDSRVVGPATRLAASFARLGFHQGFGLSVTLPAIVGPQRGAELLYTGRRVGGEEALRIGLADRTMPSDQVRERAMAFAAEIAASACALDQRDTAGSTGRPGACHYLARRS